MSKRSSWPVLLASVALLGAGLQNASAGVIGTQEYLQTLDRDAARARVDAVLARAEVRAELERLGVDAKLTAERVAALTDQELEQLALNLEELPAGGDALAVIGIVFLVLLVLELVGVIDIFNKI